jgi:hypothetical protein
VLALALAACAPLYTTDAELAAPRSHHEWKTLIESVRNFQGRIGFEPTTNFLRADASADGYAFCGHGSPLYLPYSYQDPGIRWVDARSENECRASSNGTEASFATTEAVAGRGTVVNAKLLVAPVARFLYVVMHEDCHEQFGLPPGIEEALCNLLAHAAMAQIAEERFRDAPDDYNAIRLYARAGAARAEFTRELYEEVAALYAQRERAMTSEETLLREREDLFRQAERRLARPEGALNNVWLATMITYSRHYRLMQRTLHAFDGDLAQTVGFFRRLDAAQTEVFHPVAHGCPGNPTVAFVRAYETAIADVIERSLETGNMPGLPRVADWSGVDMVTEARLDCSAGREASE